MTTDYDRILALAAAAEPVPGFPGALSMSLDPDTVRHLVARAKAADAAEAEVKRLWADLLTGARAADDRRSEIDALRADVERLKREAVLWDSECLRLGKERADALNEVSRLRARLDALTSPEAVEAVARALFTAPKREGEQTYYPTLAAAAVRALADYTGEVTT